MKLLPRNKKVLHLTAHMGGGVGAVMRSLIEALRSEACEYEHEIVSFEYINEQSLKWAVNSGIPYQHEVWPDDLRLHKSVENADIVHLHFWNHPSIFHFLSSFSGRKARMVIWSHVNGWHAPYKFSENVVRFPEIFVTSTPYSLDSEVLSGFPAEYREKHIRCVFSTSGIDRFKDVKPLPHDTFNIGYVGTVDRVKMHPDYLELCAKIEIPGARFIVCGGDRHNEMRDRAASMGIGEIFDFRGHVSDVVSILAEFDVFGYPLNPRHYGTGEQALIEAMASGVPQVVLDNGPERYVVKNEVTGFVAGSVSEYIDAVRMLYADPFLRRRLSEDSRRVASEHFSITKAAAQWLSLYEELMIRPKKICSFASGRIRPGDGDIGPVELFFSSSFLSSMHSSTILSGRTNDLSAIETSRPSMIASVRGRRIVKVVPSSGILRMSIFPPRLSIFLPLYLIL